MMAKSGSLCCRSVFYEIKRQEVDLWSRLVSVRDVWLCRCSAEVLHSNPWVVASQGNSREFVSWSECNRVQGRSDGYLWVFWAFLLFWLQWDVSGIYGSRTVIDYIVIVIVIVPHPLILLPAYMSPFSATTYKTIV
jgi:hypothetical protein